jgi:hypothetical protein
MAGVGGQYQSAKTKVRGLLVMTRFVSMGIAMLILSVMVFTYTWIQPSSLYMTS